MDERETNECKNEVNKRDLRTEYYYYSSNNQHRCYVSQQTRRYRIIEFIRSWIRLQWPLPFIECPHRETHTRTRTSTHRQSAWHAIYFFCARMFLEKIDSICDRYFYLYAHSMVNPLCCRSLFTWFRIKSNKKTWLNYIYLMHCI